MGPGDHLTAGIVLVDAGDAELTGDLATPDVAAGLVLFAHGSGSSRHSPRNRAVAAGLRSALVRAVVSRGGRPDLAGPVLGQVRAPVLLIVGGRDTQVAERNQMASRRLPGRCQVRVVPGAGHLFEEPGALDQVTGLTTGWFRQYLTR